MYEYNIINYYSVDEASTVSNTIPNNNIVLSPINEESNNNNSSNNRLDLSKTATTKKRYLQQEKCINSHAMWRTSHFWENALLDGIQAQLDLTEPVLWDEMDPDMLKEKVIGNKHIVIMGCTYLCLLQDIVTCRCVFVLVTEGSILLFLLLLLSLLCVTYVALHNIVFGQLGTMSFTMHELGLRKGEVREMMRMVVMYVCMHACM